MDELTTAPVHEESAFSAHHQGEHGSRRDVLGSIIGGLCILLAFALPVAFFPSLFLSVDLVKMALLESIVLLVAALWIVRTFRAKKVAVPRSVLLAFGGVLLAQFVVSALGTATPRVSLVGSGTDLWTVSTFAMLFLLMFLGAQTLRTPRRIAMLFGAGVLSYVLLFAFHLVRHIAGPGVLSFGVFSTLVDSPIGKWNDFAVFSGAMVVAVMAAWDFVSTRAARITLSVLFLLGILVLVVANFFPAWLVVGVLGIFFVAFRVADLSEEGATRRSFLTFALWRRALSPVVAIALLGGLLFGSGLIFTPLLSSGASVGSYVVRALHSTPYLSYQEYVLAPNATANIVNQVIMRHPLLGIGPNRFQEGYLSYRDPSVNQTILWNTAFPAGMGHIPTMMAMLGILGAIIWVFFLGVLVAKARLLSCALEKRRAHAVLSVPLFMTVLYFWAIACVYLPGIAMFTFAFLFLGALIGFFAEEGVLPEVSYTLRGSKNHAVATALVAGVLLAGIAGAAVLFVRIGHASVSLAGAGAEINAGNADGAIAKLEQANGYMERDLQYRLISGIELAKISALVQQKNVDQATASAQARDLFAKAEAAAHRSVALDPASSQNYLALGDVYATAAALGVNGAASVAENWYQEALRRDPTNPSILTLIGQTALSRGDKDTARAYLLGALSERPNYPDALRGFISIETQGNRPSFAINALRSAINSDPTNIDLRVALGSLLFSLNENGSAIAEFEAAVLADPTSAIARAALAQAYAKVGRKDDAQAVAKVLLDAFPNDTGVQGLARSVGLSVTGAPVPSQGTESTADATTTEKVR